MNVGQTQPKLLINESSGETYVGFLDWWTSGTSDECNVLIL